MRLPFVFRAIIGPLALALLVVVAQASPAQQTGTIKIDGHDLNGAPANEPHIDCTFQVDFAGFPPGSTGTATFTAVNPTAYGHLLTASVSLPSGAGAIPVDLNPLLGPLPPHTTGQWHVRADAAVPGQMSKTKVFWVRDCQAPGPDPSPSPSPNPPPAPDPDPTPDPDPDPSPNPSPNPSPDVITGGGGTGPVPDPGGVRVHKRVRGDDPAVAYPFTVHCDGVELGQDAAFTLAAGQSHLISGLPAGSACTVTETDAAGADTRTRVDGARSTPGPVATISVAAGATHEVVITNTFATASGVVETEPTEDPAGDPGDPVPNPPPAPGAGPGNDPGTVPVTAPTGDPASDPGGAVVAPGGVPVPTRIDAGAGGASHRWPLHSVPALGLLGALLTAVLLPAAARDPNRRRAP